MEISVLVVRDDELDVGDDEVASSEVAEWENTREKRGDASPVSRPRFTGDDLQNHLILSYNYCIRILAIITIFLIFITYILCWG